MSRTEQTLEDLKSYLRSHSKIREQRSHMSKVSTMATFIGQPMNSRLPTGSLGLLECRWSLPGLRKLRQDGGRLLAGAGPLLEGQHIPGTHCVRGPAVLASHQSRPVCHRKRRQDRAHLGHTSWKMRIGDEHQGENINIAWSPDGKTIAVGNKEDLITFIDTRTNKIRVEEPFSFEVNEISWNNTNDLFFLTNGLGCMHILSYPSLEHQMTLKAHPANCICIEFGPTGRQPLQSHIISKYASFVSR